MTKRKPMAYMNKSPRSKLTVEQHEPYNNRLIRKDIVDSIKSISILYSLVSNSSQITIEQVLAI